MARLKPGVYREKCSQAKKLELIGELNAAAAEIAMKSNLEREKAEQAWRYIQVHPENYTNYA